MGSDEPPPTASLDSLAPEDSETSPDDPTTMSVIKNSTIPVNVDDLGPGLIVATFTHTNGTLYQGVLLQLNRERGIPCGISFPKDYCSTIPSKVTDFEGENEQPPVQQRHTYFHTNPNTPRPLRKFNRATKPPARYKNGRLALRLRHRPVLCSKCKAYCEEKNPPRNARGMTENGDSQKTATLATRRNESKSKTGDHSSSDNLVTETASEGQQSTSILDTEDYTYSVVGPNAGIVENYWKRPNPSELLQQERTRHSVKTDEKGSGMALDTPKSFLSLKSTDDNQYDLVRKSEGDTHLSSAFQTKKQNLRFCIKKLQIHKQSVVPNQNETSESSSLVEATTVDDIRAITHPVERRSSSDLSSAEERSRKRSTAVPARFRDATCITKNVFDFKKRRQGSKVAAGLELASALITHLSNPINSSTVPETLDEVHPEETTSNSSDVTTTSVSVPNSRRTPMTATKRHSLNPVSDVARTPTIKISYGSSGKGVVIEIPSKPTVEANNVEDPVSLEKAEKKALRKAKKQAKRKMSKVSEDSGCSSLIPSNCNALSNSHEFSSSHSSCSSPPPPLLTPISELCPAVPGEDYPVSLDYQCPPLIHFTKEIPLSPKKRKKEKKHKRYKERKEEDDALVS